MSLLGMQVTGPGLGDWEVRHPALIAWVPRHAQLPANTAASPTDRGVASAVGPERASLQRCSLGPVWGGEASRPGVLATGPLSLAQADGRCWVSEGRPCSARVPQRPLRGGLCAVCVPVGPPAVATSAPAGPPPLPVKALEIQAELGTPQTGSAGAAAPVCLQAGWRPLLGPLRLLPPATGTLMVLGSAAFSRPQLTPGRFTGLSGPSSLAASCELHTAGGGQEEPCWASGPGRRHQGRRFRCRLCDRRPVAGEKGSACVPISVTLQWIPTKKGHEVSRAPLSLQVT